MKMTRLIILFLILLIGRQQPGAAQEIKVFSRYNYYTSEKEVVIIAEPGPGIPIEKYKLSASNDEKPLGQSTTTENNLLSIALPLTLFQFGKTELHYVV